MRSSPWLLALCWLLASCATARFDSLPKTDTSFEFRGRMMVVAPERPRLVLFFTLRLQAQAGDLQLSSLLGLGAAQAYWDADHAWVQAQGQRRDYADYNEMMNAVLGTPLPKEVLPFWLQGKPLDQKTVTRSDAFEEMGWLIRIIDHQPRILEFSELRQPARRLRLTIEQP